MSNDNIWKPGMPLRQTPHQEMFEVLAGMLHTQIEQTTHLLNVTMSIKKLLQVSALQKIKQSGTSWETTANDWVAEVGEAHAALAEVSKNIIEMEKLAEDGEADA